MTAPKRAARGDTTRATRGDTTGAAPSPRGRRDRPRKPPRWLEHLSAAATPGERLAVSWDRLRAGLVWLRRVQRLDREQERADRAEADRIEAAVLAVLESHCVTIETRKAATRRERHPAA